MHGSALFLCLMGVAFAGTPRVVHGPRFDQPQAASSDTTIEEHPYVVSVLYLASFICAGGIISEKYFLTAAHCAPYSATGYIVRAGSTSPTSGGTYFRVKQIIRHTMYNSYNEDYDFALFQIDGTFQFGDNIAAVQLPSEEEAVPSGTSAVITAWTLSKVVLQEFPTTVLTQDNCKEVYGSRLTDRMFCGSVADDDQNLCPGQSGSPVIADGKMIGIVSWGYGCSWPGYPNVHSRVASARSWILANTGI